MAAAAALARSPLVPVLAGPMLSAGLAGLGVSMSAGLRASRGRAAVPVRLAALDREILELVCWLRVVTQEQLGRLHPDVSARTLRYRTRRLAQLGLLGRTRPYRESGSAPHHLWPTRHADALMRGEPAPRGGERHAPNPLFLAHAATITELYVTLTTAPPAGAKLAEFRREGDAREAFRDLAGKERAIAPDATVVLRESDGAELVAFVELDRGSMSRGRLRMKAGGYADYFARDGWRERYEVCPPLLFLTTTDARARVFRGLLAKLVKPSRYGDPFVAAACGGIFDLGRALRESCWIALDSDDRIRALDVLRAARAPMQRRHELARAKRERFERLLADPDALHAHLRGTSHTPADDEQRFGLRGGRALAWLLHAAELTAQERSTVRELAGSIDADPGSYRYGTLDATDDASGLLDRLAETYAERQVAEVDRLRAVHGDGPHLRAAATELMAGIPLAEHELSHLHRDAERDARHRAEQDARRASYTVTREDRARAIARAQGIGGRLRGPEPHLQEVDEELLRICAPCEETIYPDLAREPKPAPRCPYCGGSLKRWTTNDATAHGAAAQEVSR